VEAVGQNGPNCEGFLIAPEQKGTRTTTKVNVAIVLPVEEASDPERVLSKVLP
jgi:hypothetical protein